MTIETAKRRVTAAVCAEAEVRARRAARALGVQPGPKELDALMHRAYREDPAGIKAAAHLREPEAFQLMALRQFKGVAQ